MTAVELLRDALTGIPRVRLAVLFGSGASGALRAASDLDVGIIMDPGVEVTAALRVALERAVHRSVDLVPLDTAPPLLRFEVARTGTVLVERVPYAWADFKAKALIDWWDWAPTVRMMHDVMKARLQQEAGRGPA